MGSIWSVMRRGAEQAAGVWRQRGERKPAACRLPTAVRLLVVALGVALLLVIPAPTARAAPTVSDCTDSGAAGSLRDAITNAADGATITFGLNCPDASPITLTSPIIINKNLTIDGTGHTITISGGDASGIFSVQNTNFNLPSFSIAHLTIAHGGNNTAPVSVAGNTTMTLTDCTVKNNSYFATGAINNQGRLFVIGSTFRDNSTSAGFGGAIDNTNNLTVTNSTFYNNTAAGGGGAIFSDVSAPQTIVTSSTISGNTGGYGGGIRFDGTSTTTSSVFRLNNSIVAGNTTTSISPDVTGFFQASDYNLIGNGGDATLVGGHNQIGTGANPINPLLAPIANYGGLTETFPLLPGSPAIDAGYNTVSLFSCTASLPNGAGGQDQRGVARPQPANGRCDIGAFESQGFSLVKTSGDGQSAHTGAAFSQPLKVTLAANVTAEPITGGVVAFTGPTNGGASIQPNPTTATINASGVASATITANGVGGTGYTVTASAAGANSVTFTLTNIPPVVLSPSTLPDGGVGQPYSQQISASGGSGAGYTFAVTTGAPPTGLTLTTGGLLSGTPTAAGPVSFTVTATDSGNNTGSQPYTLTINSAGTTTTGQNAQVTFSTVSQNVPLAATVTTANAYPVGEGTVTFTVLAGATPVGSAVTSGTVANGQATAQYALPAGQAAGNYTIQAVYNPGPDFAGSQDATPTLTVAAVTLTLTPANLPGGTVGQAYTQQIGASGGSGAGSAFTVSLGTLPTGLTLTTGGLLSGTPTAAGPVTFTVTATDSGNNTGSQQYTLTISPAPTITTAGGVTVAFSSASQSVTLTATVTTSPPGSVIVNAGSVNFTIRQGAATIGSPANGNVTNGQATAQYTLPANTPAGTYTIDAAYSGGANFVSSGDATHMLTVVAATLTLSPASLPAGAKAVAYSQQITASGGSGTGYTFTVTGGTPPAGLSLSTSGVLSGTPSASGAATFTVTARDSAGNMGGQQYTLTIDPAPLVRITVACVFATPNTLKVGETAQCAATATYADNTERNVTGQATWQSSAPDVARVDASGALLGKSPGQVTITAVYGGQQATVRTTVPPPTPVGIQLAPAPASRPGAANVPDVGGSPAPAPPVRR